MFSATTCGLEVKPRIEERQLGVDLREVGHGVFAGSVEQMDQHTRALNVAQEGKAETHTAMVRTLDQSGMSARTSDVSSSVATPRLGSVVVKG